MHTEYNRSNRIFVTTFLLTSLLGSANPVFAGDVTEVAACGYKTSDPGESLILNQDLYAAEGQRCIEINHDNVSLDCQGYSMTGYNGTGIGVIATIADYVTIENCVVSNFGTGILVRGSAYGLVRNNQSNDNADNGIQLANLGEIPGHMNEVSDNVVNKNASNGIFIGNSGQHLVFGNSANLNVGHGIRINNSNGNTIIDNAFNRNIANGILMISGADDNEIIDNTTNRNGGNGIRLFSNSDNNVITDNTVNGNLSGIVVEESNIGNTFENNVCKANSNLDQSFEGLCK